MLKVNLFVGILLSDIGISDGVSRLGLGLETHFCECRLGLGGFRSRDFEYCKEMDC